MKQTRETTKQRLEETHDFLMASQIDRDEWGVEILEELEERIQYELDLLTIESFRYWPKEPEKAGEPSIPGCLFAGLIEATARLKTRRRPA